MVMPRPLVLLVIIKNLAVGHRNRATTIGYDICGKLMMRAQ